MAAQSLAGFDAFAGDAHPDALAAQPSPQLRMVVGLVGMELAGLAIPAPDRALSQLEGEHHRLQLAAVVNVGCGQADDQGQSGRIRQDVQLGTGFAPVHG